MREGVEAACPNRCSVSFVMRRMNYLSQMGPWARDHGDRHPGAALLLCWLPGSSWSRSCSIAVAVLYRSRLVHPVRR